MPKKAEKHENPLFDGNIGTGVDRGGGQGAMAPPKSKKGEAKVSFAPPQDLKLSHKMKKNTPKKFFRTFGA